MERNETKPQVRIIELAAGWNKVRLPDWASGFRLAGIVDQPTGVIYVTRSGEELDSFTEPFGQTEAALERAVPMLVGDCTRIIGGEGISMVYAESACTARIIVFDDFLWAGAPRRLMTPGVWGERWESGDDALAIGNGFANRTTVLEPNPLRISLSFCVTGANDLIQVINAVGPVTGNIYAVGDRVFIGVNDGVKGEWTLYGDGGASEICYASTAMMGV